MKPFAAWIGLEYPAYMARPMQRTVFYLVVLGLLALLSACASVSGPQQQEATDSAPMHWQGRIGVRVTAPQAQSATAAFDLIGNGNQGSLRLFSPFGTTLATMQWTQEDATLTVSGATQTYQSIAALTQATLGVPIPVTTVFDWLQGIPSEVPFWQPDLRLVSKGKLTASHVSPERSAEVTIVFEVQ